MKKTATAAAVTLTILLAACSSKEDSDSAAAAAQADMAPLSYAPAQSAFVIGNLAPLPQSYLDVITPSLQQLGAGTGDFLQRVIEIQGRGDANHPLIEWLREQMQRPDALANMGIALQSRFALYEIAGMPVLRQELADPQRFYTFITELQQHGGTLLTQAETNSHIYWYAPLHLHNPVASGQLRLVLSIVDDQMVVALDGQDPNLPLAQLLGLQRPDQSVLDSGELVAINEKYGYVPYGNTMVVNTQRFADFLQSYVQPQQDATSSTCRIEIAALTQQAPRLVHGSLELDGSRMQQKTVLELEPALAEAISHISAPVPGLGSSRDGMEIGFSLNITQAASLLQSRLAAVEKVPYECHVLQPLNHWSKQLRQSLGIVYTASSYIHGVRAIATELDLDKLTASGLLVVASPNPRALFGMAQAALPELSQLGLTPDGEARQLQSRHIAAITGNEQPLWVGMTDNALGMAVGTDAKGGLEAALRAKPTSPQPLFFYGSSGDAFSLDELTAQEEPLARPSPGDYSAGILYVLEPFQRGLDTLEHRVESSRTRLLASEHGLELNQDMQFTLQAPARPTPPPPPPQ